MKQESPFAPEPGTMSISARLFWCVVFFGPAAYFGYHGDHLLAAVLIGGGVGAFSGFRMGVLSFLTSIASISAAIIYAPQFGMQYESNLATATGMTGLLNRCVSIAISGVLISMLVWFAIYMTVGRIVRNRPGLDRLNRFTGFTLGFAQGVLAIVLLVGGMLMIEPEQRERLAAAGIEAKDATVIHQAVFWTVKQVDNSVVGKYLRQYNPVTKIPQLNQIQQVQQTAVVLSDPSKINHIIGYPSIIQLQQRPDVQKAVQELRSDQSLNDILTSGKPMDRAAAMTLLQHPAVLNLVDQPGFMEEAAKAIKEAGL